MRYAFVLLAALCAAPVFGQDAKQPADENPHTANWSKLGPTVEGSRGFALSSRGMRLNRSGQYELWVKITPNDTAWFVRRYDLPKTTAYVMQYATVDCAKKQLLLERTAMFDSAQKQLEGRITGITPPSRKDAVKRGSIGETVFKYVCDDPSTPPAARINRRPSLRLDAGEEISPQHREQQQRSPHSDRRRQRTSRS